MANALAASYRTLVLGSGLNLSSATIAAGLVDHADATPLPASHDFLDDFSAGLVPVAASCPSLASKTLGVVGAGVFDAADTTFSALSGDACESLVLFENTGTASTSDFIAYWDTITGLPVTPNGGDVVVVWSSSGIHTF